MSQPPPPPPPAPSPERRPDPGRLVLRWHRGIGLALSGVFIVVCVTGILLNRSQELGLDRKVVSANWIYEWYDIKPEGEVASYRFKTGYLSSLDGRLYFDDRSILPFDTLVSVVELRQFIAAASNASIVLISPQGELVKQLGPANLPGGTILGLQSADRGTLTLKTSRGVFRSDSDILAWRPDKWYPTLPTIEPSPTPPELEAAILRSFRGEGLTWSRVLLDLHSGRLFGAAGKWIADISALGLILLALTGILYTTKYLKKARTNSQT